MNTMINSPQISQQPQIKASDRLGFTIFLAICIHLVIVLGIGFVPYDKTKSDNKTLNVVLARHASDERPDKADFIGQANQLAGGESDKITPPSTPVLAPFPEQNLNPTAAMQQQKIAQTEEQNLLNSENSKNLQRQIKPQLEQQQDQRDNTGTSQTLRAQAIASLQAELDISRKAEAKKTRRRTISAAIHQTSDALYLDDWQRKVEKVGTVNYPAQARRNNLQGSLKMKVTIRYDGSIEEISLLESSGSKVLDDAALRIVRLAAPFSPLPPEIRKTTDVLEIIRVWQFLPGNRISTR
jgi:protein TonB